jgi:hypothetical protein
LIFQGAVFLFKEFEQFYFRTHAQILINALYGMWPLHQS